MMKKRPEGQKRVLVAKTTKPLEEPEEKEVDAGYGSLNDSEDEKETTPVPVKTSVKKVVRRVKKVTRKAVTTAEE